MTRLGRTAGAAIAAALVSSVLAASAGAAVNTFTVDSNLDPGDGFCGTGNCTLREAINAANDGDTADQDRIHISFGLSAAQRTIALAATLPTIDEPLAIDSTGFGVPIISGGDAVRPFLVDGDIAGADVSLRSLVIRDGAPVVGNGGGISSTDADLTILDSAITENVAPGAGGIQVSNGTLTVERSLVSMNEASTGGGGGINVGGGSTLVVRRSTLTGNHTSDDNQPGGGVAANAATTTIESSTISGNRTEGSSANGAGLFVASATVRNSTISGNSTQGGASQGGGIYAVGADPVLANTIVADNSVLGGGTGSDLRSNSTNDDFQLGYTLVETVPAADSFTETVPGSNLYAIDPALGALQSNGGPTPTQMPGPTSAVIDKGSTDEATDQRGRSRPADYHSRSNPDDGADVGAVEVQIGPPTFIGTTPASPSTDDTPQVRGSVPAAPEIDSANPVVQLFTSADCVGGAVGPASVPATFADPGIAVGRVAHNGTTTFHGRLTTDYGTSLCSPTSISYTQADPFVAPPSQSGATAPAETGERAAALRECKAKKRRLQRKDRPWRKKYARCRRRALQLPV